MTVSADKPTRTCLADSRDLRVSKDSTAAGYLDSRLGSEVSLFASLSVPIQVRVVPIGKDPSYRTTTIILH